MLYQILNQFNPLSGVSTEFENQMVEVENILQRIFCNHFLTWGEKLFEVMQKEIDELTLEKSAKIQYKKVSNSLITGYGMVIAIEDSDSLSVQMLSEREFDDDFSPFHKREAALICYSKKDQTVTFSTVSNNDQTFGLPGRHCITHFKRNENGILELIASKNCSLDTYDGHMEKKILSSIYMKKEV